MARLGKCCPCDPPCNTWILKVMAMYEFGGWPGFMLDKIDTDVTPGYPAGIGVSAEPGAEPRYQKQTLTQCGFYYNTFDPPNSDVEMRQSRITAWIHPQKGDIYKVTIEDDLGGDWRTIYTKEIQDNGDVVEDDHGLTLTDSPLYGKISDDYPITNESTGIYHPSLVTLQEVSRSKTTVRQEIVPDEGVDTSTIDPILLDRFADWLLEDAKTLSDAHTLCESLLGQIDLDDDTNKYHLHEHPSFDDSRDSLGERWLKPHDNDIVLPGGAEDYYPEYSSDVNVDVYDHILIEYTRATTGIEINLNPYDGFPVLAEIYSNRNAIGALAYVNNGHFRNEGSFSQLTSGVLILLGTHPHLTSILMVKTKVATSRPRHSYNANGYASDPFTPGPALPEPMEDFTPDEWNLSFPTAEEVTHYTPEQSGIAPPSIPFGDPENIPKWYPNYFIYEFGMAAGGNIAVRAVFCPNM